MKVVHMDNTSADPIYERMAYKKMKYTLSHTSGSLYPVNLSIRAAQSIAQKPLKWRNYYCPPKKMKVSNTGKTVMVSGKWHGMRPYIMEGPLDEKYLFSQIHFHWSTSNLSREHHVEGTRFPVEVHIVHFNAKYSTLEEAKYKEDGIAVTVFFMKMGIIINIVHDDWRAGVVAHGWKEFRVLLACTNMLDNVMRSPKDLPPKILADIIDESPNYSLNQLLSALDGVHKAYQSVHIEPIPLTSLNIELFNHDYFIYSGTSGKSRKRNYILWLIYPKPIGISASQVEKFRSLESSGIVVKSNMQESCKTSNLKGLYYVRGVLDIRKAELLASQQLHQASFSIPCYILQNSFFAGHVLSAQTLKIFMTNHIYNNNMDIFTYYVTRILAERSLFPFKEDFQEMQRCSVTPYRSSQSPCVRSMNSNPSKHNKHSKLKAKQNDKKVKRKPSVTAIYLHPKHYFNPQNEETQFFDNSHHFLLDKSLNEKEDAKTVCVQSDFGNLNSSQIYREQMGDSLEARISEDNISKCSTFVKPTLVLGAQSDSHFSTSDSSHFRLLHSPNKDIVSGPKPQFYCHYCGIKHCGNNVILPSFASNKLINNSMASSSLCQKTSETLFVKGTEEFQVTESNVNNQHHKMWNESARKGYYDNQPCTTMGNNTFLWEITSSTTKRGFEDEISKEIGTIDWFGEAHPEDGYHGIEDWHTLPVSTIHSLIRECMGSTLNRFCSSQYSLNENGLPKSSTRSISSLTYEDDSDMSIAEARGSTSIRH